MSATYEYLKKEFPNIILFIAWSLILVFIVFLSNYKNSNLPLCTQSDVYKTSVWSDCSKEWIQTRSIDEIKDVKCSNLWDIEKPDEKRTCIYLPKCTEASWKIWEFGLCTDWFKSRNTEKIGTCEWWYTPENKVKCTEKQVYLFKDWIKAHTTIVENWGYSNINNNNLQITSSWKISSAKLIIKGRTTIKDWSIIKRAEYYYFLFSLSNNIVSIPRIIGTSRIKDNWVDMNDSWLFQWTDTPKTIEFDLSSLKTALPKWKVWSEIINYIDIINNSNWNKLYMTLYMWDWISMLRDENNRIYWTIYESYIEYKCTDDLPCSIERIPSLN